MEINENVAREYGATLGRSGDKLINLLPGMNVTVEIETG